MYKYSGELYEYMVDEYVNKLMNIYVIFITGNV